MRLAILAVLAIFGIAAGSFFNLTAIERKAVYPFDATRVPPAQVGLPQVTEHKFRTNGRSLIVWTAAADPGAPTILYFHGNAGNLANRAGRFRHFLNRGYGLIAPAYRGSSGSTGKPSEKRLTRDAVQLYQNLEQLLPGTRAKNLVIYGESLGTGVALKLVAQPGIPAPRAVVLEAPYTSLPDVVLHTYPQFEPLLDQMKNIWDSRTHARALRAPLLVMHGTQDPLIPIEQGRQVFDLAGSADKQFLKVRGAGHTGIWRSDTLPKLWRFIDRH